MGIFTAIMAGLKLVAAPIGTALKGWQQQKQVKLESNIQLRKAKTEAMIEKMKQGQLAEIQWDLKSLDTAGWKDEWFTILLSIPAVLCFVPGMDKVVSRGFEALSGTPDWYKIAFITAVSASFGMRKLVNYMMQKGTGNNGINGTGPSGD